MPVFSKLLGWEMVIKEHFNIIDLLKPDDHLDKVIGGNVNERLCANAEV